MTQNQAAGVLAVSVVLVVLVFLFTFTGAKRLVRLLLNSALGFMVMLLLNSVGIPVAINWVSLAASGLLGLPGVALVALVQNIFA